MNRFAVMNPTAIPPSPSLSTAPSASPEEASGGAAASPKLSLTDFLDLETLQDIQDSFAAITRLVTTIQDPDGNTITAPTDHVLRDASDRVLLQLIGAEADADGAFIAPILVEGQQLGSIRIKPQEIPGVPVRGEESDPLSRLLERLNLDSSTAAALIEAAEATFAANRGASIQFLFLLANAIARLCYEQYQAKQRLEELSVLYQVSSLLSGHRELPQVLDAAARSIAEVMQVKAASIRLLQGSSGDGELVPKAVYQLSRSYIEKGKIRVSASSFFQQALAGKTIYIQDMSTDPRVLYPGDAQQEGLVSMLCVGLIFQGRPIGTIQLFTGEVRKFTHFQTKLVEAIAKLLATAIENAQLDAERQANQQMVRQLRLAADVQRRMLPATMPSIPGVEVAARYVPSMELAGDFYDFVELHQNVAFAIGDVVGKGVAASLLMASVRASLRAYAQDVYDLDEVIARVNTALCRDTLDNEFVTLWYGTLDAMTLRLTYCNAGHEPALLLRDDRIHLLDAGGMIIGVDRTQTYEKGLVDLRPGDLLLLFTDGLVDAFNHQGERFGRRRIEMALRAAAQKNASDGLNHILWEMRNFTGLRRASDDTTVVLIKVNEYPSRAAAGPYHATI